MADLTDPHVAQQWKEQAEAGISALALKHCAVKIERLKQFVIFLQRWNRAYNLTAHQDAFAILSYHILDSLALAPHIHGERILDVGTGGGFPGVPLAIWFPKKKFVLLDANGKKVRFLVQAIADLNFENVTCVKARMENFQYEKTFDIITSRAVKDMHVIAEQTTAVLHPNGQWLFMKGADLADQLTALTLPHRVFNITVPGIAQQRHVVQVQPTGE